jgi:hypothetical protein
MPKWEAMVDNLFRVELKGARAKLGEVLATDVARLLIGVERSMAAAAASVIGRRQGVGRRIKAVEASTRLRLVGIEAGNSVDVLLRVPEGDEAADDQLELDDQTLGQLAAQQLLNALESEEPDPQIARTIVELSTEVGLGTRYDAVVFVERVNAHARTATLDVPRRDQMRSWLSSPAAREADEMLAGKLVEVDFENMSARLRDPYMRPIDVVFPEELADDIQAALRAQAQFQAHVVYDSRTSTARRVELREVLRGRQLELETMTQRFLHGADLETLVREQGVAPIEDPASLRFTGATDEELDDFLAGLESEA